ncbi:MAG: helicase-related protein [Eubacteriales bacterium]|nr:helicase-related protein [Eubacteriales bacterium]
MKKKSNRHTKKETENSSRSPAESGLLPENPAADLEQSLKSRIDSLPYRRLIREIRVSESKSGKSLNVTIVPEGEIVSFGTLNIDLGSINSASKWKRKKKDVYGHVKGYLPRVNPGITGRILEAANASLAAWRETHPFTDEMRNALSSRAGGEFFSARKTGTLRFLAGKEQLCSDRTEISPDALAVEFKGFPYKAAYDIRTGEIRFSLSRADSLYEQYSRAMKDVRMRDAITAYLEEKEIPAEVWYAGKPGTFQISFRFALCRETETVHVETYFRRIVSAACKSARERADQKENELAGLLKTCPYYGTYIAQAVLTTIEENGNNLTKNQIVNLLRGVNVSDDYSFGDFSGKYNLMSKAELAEVMDVLLQFGVIRERCVHGDYQNYYVCHVTPEGKFFESLQNDPVPGKNPVTEQEYHLVFKAVREDIPRLSEKEKQKLLQAVVEKPGLFLTDPELILDCAERMGRPAAEYLQTVFKTEADRTNRRILKLLYNAADGKGKELPKNGVDAFRERKERRRREQEEAERRDRQLFELVLTEIPDNYVDLYPAARQMRRQFVLHIGPTNSGKTHDAIEELMRAETGIYLAPLRLLAYEQYERLNRSECPCSLVTGEEQYLIDGAKHQSSTIEMLSLKTYYDTAVIDEAQMIADRGRGGAWTAAIMGVCAQTVHVCAAPDAERRLIEIIRDCGDEYRIVRHRRMTPLVFEDKPFSFPEDVKAGDALIVFSRRNVHAVAAHLQNKHIKCSIIYGALPYDVRHRQAELFASGETEVVVATDAIGMGMNLPIRRVVLMETGKYDGFTRRPLTYGEIAQIIGRAGRYGIYDVGYAAAANGDEKVGKAINRHLPPIEKAVIDFPETLLTVDATILDLIRKWEQVVPAEGWQKESVEQFLRLAEMTADLHAPKRLAYDFLTVPFEDENSELLNIWYDVYEKEVRGEPYSIYDLAAAVRLRSPVGVDAIDALEQQHRVLDLYFSLARKFQPQENTLEYIMDRKRDCSERIMKVLARQGFKEKRCKFCGKLLPWNHPYGICERCWQRQ